MRYESVTRLHREECNRAMEVSVSPKGALKMILSKSFKKDELIAPEVSRTLYQI